MLSKFRSYRPAHGTVVGYIALFIALGGTSWAVATGSIDSREIKNNTVRSKDIRNNDIRGRDVRRGAIRSSDVANASLLAGDFAPGHPPPVDGDRRVPAVRAALPARTVRPARLPD